MISKQEQAREQRGRKGFIRAMAGFFTSFFCPARPVPVIRDEPFELSKTKPLFKNRYEGFTFKRIKKIGNYFAYGWVKTDRRKT